jgi:uncharacterized protein GlcG (DUF336 family)
LHGADRFRHLTGEHHAKRTSPPSSSPAFAVAFIATAASAEGVRTEKNMSLELANQIAAHTVAACTASGYNVTATVVDRAGTVRAVQRADNAGPHTLEASRLKAYTSASAKNTTLAMMEGAQKNPAAANLVPHPRLPAAGRRCAGEGGQRSDRRRGRGRRARRPPGRAMRCGCAGQVPRPAQINPHRLEPSP